MGKGVASWLLPVAAVAATVLTGGAAAPAIAGAAGAGAAGAGAATGAGLLGAGAVGTAGGALAAQGAAGLLGGAGAAAAGYGAGAAGAGLAGAAASELPSGMAAYGPNGEYTGATIANDGMSANSLTGGYDALNPLQRGMQRLGGMDFNKGMKMAKSGTDLMGNPQYQQGPQNVSSNAQVAPRQQQMPQGSFADSSNMSPEEIKRRSWLQNLGNPNA